MAAGYTRAVALEVATAAQLNTVMDQVETRHASTTARNNALSGILTEGLFAYTTNNDTVYWYDGSAWKTWSTGWKTWTVSYNNLTLGNGSSPGRYRYRNGDLELRTKTTFGSTTSISGTVTVTLPASETSNAAVGSYAYMSWDDASAGAGAWGVSECAAGATVIDLFNVYGVVVDAANPFFPSVASGDSWVIDMRVAL